MYIDEFAVALQPLQLRLEQDIAARLLRFVASALHAVDEATDDAPRRSGRRDVRSRTRRARWSWLSKATTFFARPEKLR